MFPSDEGQIILVGSACFHASLCVLDDEMTYLIDKLGKRSYRQTYITRFSLFSFSPEQGA